MIVPLIKKEFLDMARDRRTVIMSLAIPFILFPLLMTVVSKVARSTSKAAKERVLDVALVQHGGADAFRRMLQREGDLLAGKGTLRLREDVALEEGCALIEADSLDAMVVFDRDFERLRGEGLPGRVSVYYKETQDKGKREKRRVLAIVNAYRDLVEERRMAELELDPPIDLQPIEINEFNLASDKEHLAGLAGRFLPYLFIIFAISGCMQPATDLAAGEKERGTLETLLTVPATRLQILFAKFCVVVTSGYVSSLVTMAGLYVAIQLVDLNSGDMEELNKAVMDLLEPMTIVSVFSLLLPVTVFFGAIALTISIYSKSTKEAQSLLMPLIFIGLFPLYASILPGLELSAKTALIPVLNVALSIKAIIAGTAQTLHLLIVYGSLIGLALAALWLCSWMFQRESAVFRS